eukprot:6145800-Pyramimonas_sp.AAC.1
MALLRCRPVGAPATIRVHAQPRDRLALAWPTRCAGAVDVEGAERPWWHSALKVLEAAPVRRDRGQPLRPRASSSGG